MLKKISLGLLISMLSTPIAYGEDLFSESYSDEKVREEIEKNIKKNEVIAPEEIAAVQNQFDRKNNVKIRNTRPEQAKEFMNISTYIFQQADENYKPTQKENLKAFYDENLEINISDLANSSPDDL